MILPYTKAMKIIRLFDFRINYVSRFNVITHDYGLGRMMLFWNQFEARNYVRPFRRFPFLFMKYTTPAMPATTTTITAKTIATI